MTTVLTRLILLVCLSMPLTGCGNQPTYLEAAKAVEVEEDELVNRKLEARQQLQIRKNLFSTAQKAEAIGIEFTDEEKELQSENSDFSKELFDKRIKEQEEKVAKVKALRDSLAP